MSIKLRDLIKAVRACKTAADERAVVTKESALIRSSFKDEAVEYRHRYVPVHFDDRILSGIHANVAVSPSCHVCTFVSVRFILLSVAGMSQSSCSSG